MYEKGDRVQLVSMPEEPDPIPIGTKGTVVFVNLAPGIGTQVEIKWDNGRTLMACLPPDLIRVIEEE